MKNILKKACFFIEIWFIILGFLSSSIIFHEIYHLHLDGEASGVCFGHCFVSEKQSAPAAIHWSEPVRVGINEERNAWIFGLAIAGLLLVIFLIGLQIEN